jgi:benzodiazapine receptor
MKEYLQYEQWVKPFFAPPEWAFGVVWPVLYLIIFVSFGWVFWKVFVKKDIPKNVLVPFILNLVFNFSFTPIMFGLENLWLAAADILLVLITIVWVMVVIKKYSKKVFWAQVPYLIWVSFATVLQLSILFLNTVSF